MVIDGHEFLTGSFNFAKAAETESAENLLGIEDAKVAAKYTTNWQERSEHSEAYRGG